MNLISVVAHHGYLITAGMVFASAAGVPMPVSVVLLLAGAAAHGGNLHLPLVLLVAWMAASMGDTLLFLGGRFTGWWLLSLMCRLSVNPEACIFGAAEYFYRRGPHTLLFAKFLPGLGTMAAPLAGSLHMRLRRFLRMDLTGAALYCSTWTLTGYLLSRWIDDVVRMVERAGHVMGVTIFVLLVGYGVMMAVRMYRDRHYAEVPRISAEELKQRMAEDDSNKVMVIADVRSHGYYDPGGQRIKNSIRVEPSRLMHELVALREFMAPECEVYVYCSCVRNATSVRIAHMLSKKNCRTQVIDGGLRAWIKAGGELEPVPAADVEHLPRFN